ncbi:MAG: hypothetical protein UY39_C0028G0002 [Candidatus Kaiserbacteria bacterium GW2011_GWC2_49_12]|uniref:Uncharacterized protein n=3 Tax=Candidatus Kaiseribacteriota TaxID=1752734 RepID=A0A0G1WEQ8_9BACT|nr:MAG: hypothetical protein UY39_C0028G0002 [Candidatus Kaiserbacteria bacterium GW2011_GWC2_49_12]KKW17263.1 MAG: hypothetical protein UY57_C0020G0002 [Candidatus Kaiserbacteria bacterium GW2011_GWB1_50_17]KKW18039.1 MAG: hypothetical protein UY59_C0018G0004 [Candidatus Kaiserbacteria bacterium GW2011_GWA1_50_28]
MDTSIRLEMAREKLGTICEQVARTAFVAQEVLRATKPYMTYLSGFTPLDEYMSGTSGITAYDKSQWPVDVWIYKFPVGVSGRTRVRRLEILINQREGVKRSQNARRIVEKRWMYTKTLLITQGGEVLVWDLTTHRFRKGKKRRMSIRSKFRILEGRRALATYLSNAQTARVIVVALGWMVTDTLEERRERLKATAELETFIKMLEQHMW